LRPYQHPPKRHNLPLGLGGGGGRIQSGAERKGQECKYHEVDDDDDNNGKGGEHGKSINDSISEHKCIVTSNIIYSTTVSISINNNCSSVSATRLQKLTELRDSLNLTKNKAVILFLWGGKTRCALIATPNVDNAKAKLQVTCNSYAERNSSI
jgi:hypothetical protein